MSREYTKLEINYDLVGIAFDKIDEVTIPVNVPHPPFKLIHGDPAGIRLPAYFAWDLERSAIILAEMSIKSAGNYYKGMEAPSDCVSYSVGAILTAFSAIEAYINETITIHTKHNRKKGELILSWRKYKKLHLMARLELLMGDMGIDFSFGAEPFWSVKKLYAMRNALVHHEGGDNVSGATGFYPKEKLKDIARIIKSNYIDDEKVPYNWQTHALTPNGAVWAVNTMLEVVNLIEVELERYE